MQNIAFEIIIHEDMEKMLERIINMISTVTSILAVVIKTLNFKYIWLESSIPQFRKIQWLPNIWFILRV